jgi:hypothetical protein
MIWCSFVSVVGVNQQLQNISAELMLRGRHLISAEVTAWPSNAITGLLLYYIGRCRRSLRELDMVCSAWERQYTSMETRRAIEVD